MTAKIWKMLLAAPVAGAALFMSTAPMASAQVTSISQLSDVQPTDWAFQALQSLVERYGCIAGYPDGTFRGNRAMTRFEFAAGMNACLDRINELIAAGLADKVSREDLATVQRLQEEFAAELAALRGRVDALEATTAELQAQQFSTTTKLRGQVITGLFAGTDVNAIVPYRVRLNFDASFFGSDRLRVRLQARDANLNADPVGLGFESGSSPGSNVVLDDLFYRFTAFDDRVLFFAGLNSSPATDFFTYGSPLGGLSDFGDAPDVSADIGSPFALNGARSNTASFGFNWQLADWATLAYGYTSFNSTDSTSTNIAGTFVQSGVFDGRNAHSVELAFTPSETLIVALSYTNYQDGAGSFRDPNFTTGSGDAFGIAVNWEITPRVIFTGFFATADFSTTTRNLRTGAATTTNVEPTDWLIGFVFPDLFMEGAEGGVLVGQPESFTGFSDSKIYEAYYTFPVSRNISITPGVYHISDPTGPNTSGVTVGGVRTTFSF